MRDKKNSVASMAPVAVPIGARPRRGSDSPHLVGDRNAAALTRLEMGVLRVQEAFASWVVELHKHCAGGRLNFHDIALLHCVRLRGGTPTLSDMLVFLHRMDLSALQYSFRKLEKLGLVRRVRGAVRREVAYDVTEQGRELTTKYARLRHEMLVHLIGDIVDMDESMHAAAAVLERLVGIYDQATQSILNERLMATSSTYAMEQRPPATTRKPARRKTDRVGRDEPER